MSLPFLEKTLQKYANEDRAIARADSKLNFCVVPDPQNAEPALAALRNSLGWPCLVLEFPDNDVSEESATFDTLRTSIAVLHFSDVKNSGKNDAKSVIYEVCKPTLERIIGRLKKEAKKKIIKDGCTPLQVMSRVSGEWIGPVLNGAWGYRYTIEIRFWRDPFHCD